MKAWQGAGRKGRLRRKHRRDIAFHNSPGCLPQSVAGVGREMFGGYESTPAPAKVRYVPHDCKQYDFPSGAPE